MTTLLCIKTDKFILLGADRQITSDNLKLPVDISKIVKISGNCLLSFSGSLGLAQQVAQIGIREIKASKIFGDDDNPLAIYPHELASRLARLNFELPLEYKHSNFISSSYILAGVEENGELRAYSIDATGGLIPVTSIASDGSGGNQLGLSLLQKAYNPSLSLEEAAWVIADIFRQVNNLDIYTSNYFDIYKIDANGITQIDFTFKKKNKKNKQQKKK